MFPVRPDHLGIMAPIPAVATLPGSATPGPGDAASIAAQVERRVGEFLADLRPEGAVATFLVRHAAVLSVRLERCARHEAATIALRVRRAEAEYTAHRLAEIDHLHSWLNAEPATYARRLRQSPEGIDRMVDSWLGLRAEITDPDFPRWGADHRTLAEGLTGRRPSDLPVSAIQLYSEAYFGQPSPLVEANAELARLQPAGRQEFARRKLVAIIDAELDRLARDRAAIDPAALARDRLEAADRALFDPSPSANLARRYELATERGLIRALRTIADLEVVPEGESAVEPDDVVEAAPDPTLQPEPIDQSRGRRSRRALASLQAARRAAAARARMHDRDDNRPPLDPPRSHPGIIF